MIFYPHNLQLINEIYVMKQKCMDKVTFSPPLSENAAGNVNSLVSGYLSHLRKFRLFLDSDGTADPSALKQKKTSNRVYTRKKKMDVDVPYPSI